MRLLVYVVGGPQRFDGDSVKIKSLSGACPSTSI